MRYMKYAVAVCKVILAIVNYPERFCGFPESCTGSHRISNYPLVGVGKSNFYLALFNLNLNSISLYNRVAYSVWRHVTKLWSTSVCIFTVHNYMFENAVNCIWLWHCKYTFGMVTVPKNTQLVVVMIPVYIILFNDQPLFIC